MTYVTKTRLYATGDRSRLVPEGDPEAVFLVAYAGDTLDEEVVERYGLRKQQKPAANKQRKPSANK